MIYLAENIRTSAAEAQLHKHYLWHLSVPSHWKRWERPQELLMVTGKKRWQELVIVTGQQMWQELVVVAGQER